MDYGLSKINPNFGVVKLNIVCSMFVTENGFSSQTTLEIEQYFAVLRFADQIEVATIQDSKCWPIDYGGSIRLPSK